MNAPARRGRPRDVAIDEAIREATIDELVLCGFVGLSMEAVAARAGVAKTTVYRRWPNTTELALHAMSAFEQEVPNPPEGTVREQLVWLLDQMRRKWSDPRYAAIMRRVTGDGASYPDAYRQARDRLVLPRLKVMNAVLRRGVDEGVLRHDADVEWLRQLLSAPIMAATLTFKERVSRAQLEATVDVVLRGAAP